jgi:hypothetical protein
MSLSVVVNVTTGSASANSCCYDNQDARSGNSHSQLPLLLARSVLNPLVEGRGLCTNAVNLKVLYCMQEWM